MPNRILKESICSSEDIDQLKPFEETVFYRLIVNCDDYGKIDARPSFLKSKLFVTKQGVTLQNIEDAILKLASVGLVQLYTVNEKPFLLFPKWELHQQIRAKKSKYPSPDENGYQMISDDCRCPRNPIQSESEKEKERDTNVSPKKKFIPPSVEEVVAYCRERKNGIDAEAFIAFYASKGWKVGNQSMKDWKSAIITWEKKDGKKPHENNKSGGWKPL